MTYEKEVNVYNPGAVGTGIENAGKTATRYVTDLSDGIMVHPEGEGPNDTATPTGWRIRDALEMLRGGVSLIKAWAESNVPKVRIGREDSAHMLLEDGRIAGYSDASSIYFEVGDTGGAVTQTYTGDGETQYFDVYYATEIESATVNGTAVTCTLQNAAVAKLATVPAAGATVVIKYTSSETAPYFTFGTRGSGQVGIGSSSMGEANKVPGIFAHSEGSGNTAYGFASHAEGQGCLAYGSSSHAQGWECSAGGKYSHAGGQNCNVYGNSAFAHGDGLNVTQHAGGAFGYYNDPSGLLFSIGNGTSANRKNAFGVGTTGNAFFEGQLRSGTQSSSVALFRTADWSFGSYSIAAGGKISSTQTKSVAVPGYTPVGVVGIALSGTNATACHVYAYNLSGNNVVFNAYNTGSSAATLTVGFKILYMATAAL